MNRATEVKGPAHSNEMLRPDGCSGLIE
jgi:hypothetical protein